MTAGLSLENLLAWMLHVLVLASLALSPTVGCSNGNRLHRLPRISPLVQRFAIM